MMPLESTSTGLRIVVVLAVLTRHLGRHFEVLSAGRAARKRGAQPTMQPVTDPCSRGPLALSILEARP